MWVGPPLRIDVRPIDPRLSPSILPPHPFARTHADNHAHNHARTQSRTHIVDVLGVGAAYGDDRDAEVAVVEVEEDGASVVAAGRAAMAGWLLELVAPGWGGFFFVPARCSSEDWISSTHRSGGWIPHSPRLVNAALCVA